MDRTTHSVVWQVAYNHSVGPSHAVILRLTKTQTLHDNTLSCETCISVHLHTEDLVSGITFADMFFKRRVRLCLRLGRVSAPAAAEEPLEQRELLCARLAEYDGVDSLEVRRVREVRDLEVVGAVGERWA